MQDLFFLNVFLSKPSSSKSYTTVLSPHDKQELNFRVCQLMLLTISLPTGLSKEWTNMVKLLVSRPRCWELLPLHLTSSNDGWWQLGVTEELTRKIWIPFLVERTQNSKTMSMYMPPDCTQAWKGTLTCLFVDIQKSLTCLSLQFLRMTALALLYSQMSMPSQSPDILYQAVWIQNDVCISESGYFLIRLSSGGSHCTSQMHVNQLFFQWCG